MHVVRIARLLLCAVVASPASGQSPSASSARLDSTLRALEGKGFSGAVRLDRDGVPLIEKGYGVANRTAHIRFTPQTIVQIGSNTKDFTLVSLLQLSERRRVNINDSLSKYFPTAPADKRNITLWQLATHRAGFPLALGRDVDPLTRDQFIAAAMHHPLSFPPGTRESYSNTGYSLLAAVIEQASGTTYDEYVGHNILARLGLTHTGLLLPHFDVRQLAHGYADDGDRGTMLDRPHAADGPYWNLRGNGGMLSTLDDMHAFYGALFGTAKLLKPATRRLSFDPDAPVALAGSDRVSSFLYERLPMLHVELIVASNDSRWPVQRVRQAIGEVLGLPSTDGGPPLASGPTTPARPPSPPIAAMVTEFIGAINTADPATVRAFVAAHFTSSAGAPTLDERVKRLVAIHGNLGTLTIVSMDQADPGVVTLSITAASGDPATMKVRLNGSGPSKIDGIQMVVGG